MINCPKSAFASFEGLSIESDYDAVDRIIASFNQKFEADAKACRYEERVVFKAYSMFQ